jgi:transaldolase
MKFFIDTADIAEIKAAHDRGWVDGVTTNPSLIAKSGRPIHEVIKEICGIVNGPISAEVLSLEAKEMFREGMELAKIHKNVVVKVPMTEEGMIAVKKFAAEGIRTNVTLCFSPLQALLAAKAGAYLISPFVGRLDDISYDGMKLIRQIRTIYDNYEFKTEVLVASIRNPVHLVKSALMGADVATIPFSVMKQMTHHPLTDKGIEKFLADAKGKK